MPKPGCKEFWELYLTGWETTFQWQLHTLKGSSFYCTLCPERWRFSIPPVTPCRAFALAVASAGGVETQMSIHLTSFLRAFAQMSPLSYPIETSIPQPWYSCLPSVFSLFTALTTTRPIMYLPYFIGLLSESFHEDGPFLFCSGYVPCAWHVTSVQVLNRNGT